MTEGASRAFGRTVRRRPRRAEPSVETAGVDHGARRRGTHAGDLSDRFFWVSVLIAALPIVVAAVRGCLQDWNPVSDNGLVAIRSFDVLTRHPPLLGLWSSASLWSKVQFNLPGPLEFELLAVPVHVLGLRVGTATGMAMVNAAAVVATAMLARRRAGSQVAVGAMVFVLTLEWSMGSEFLYDPWPINSAPFIFVLFLFAAWSVGDGDLAILPVLAFCASYLVQTHLSYVVLVPLVGALALGGFGLHLRERRRHDPDGWPARRRRARLGLAASVVFTLALWAPPIYQELAHRPGNLSQLAKASGAKPPRPPEVRAAVIVVGSTVALPPWWLPPSYGSPAFDLTGSGRPLLLASAAISLLTAAGMALAYRAIRRHDRTSTAVLAVAGGALLASLITVYKSPSPVGYSANYLRWLWATSMFCWFAVATAVVRLTDSSMQSQRRHRLSLTLVAGVVVICVLALPKVDNGVFAPAAGPIAESLVKRALPQLHGTSPIRVQLEPVGLPGDVGPLVLVELQRRGTNFVVDDEVLVRQLGEGRRWNGHDATSTLRVDSSPSPPEGFRRIATYYGLSRSEQVQLERLNAEVRRWLIATGGPRLSRVGRRLVAGNQLRKIYFDRLRTLAAQPDNLMADSGFQAALAKPVSDRGERSLFLRTDPLGDRKATLWAALRQRSGNERVSIDLAPERALGNR